jgi:hypothetical protein
MASYSAGRAGGVTSHMTALTRLRIEALVVEVSVLQAPHLRHLSLIGSKGFCMDVWPQLGGVSRLSRLDLVHVPGPDMMLDLLHRRVLPVSVVLPHVTTLNLQFGCANRSSPHPCMQPFCPLYALRCPPGGFTWVSARSARM